MFQTGWFRILFILAILMVCFLWYKRQDLSNYYEGFVQDSPYVFKNNHRQFDQFYAEIYNQLMIPQERCTFEVEKIIEMTQPTNRSSFLDIGSGTGELPGYLAQKGFDSYALDISKDMIQYINTNHSGVQTKCDNAKNSLTYEKGSFTHITMTGLSFYLFENKDEILRNCFYWLKPGGYLVLHLIDREKFDPIIPGGKPSLLNNPQQYASQRITDTNIDFVDFQYSGSYDFSKNNQMCLKETFTDDLTKHVRQQETKLYVEPMTHIMNIASKCGFIPHGQVTFANSCYFDEHQFLVILERGQ